MTDAEIQREKRPLIGSSVEKTGGKYGGPGVLRGIIPDANGDDLYLVGHQIEGGYGEFVHVYPPRIVSALAHTAKAATFAPEGMRERVRHRKRGTEYEVLGVAEAQVAVGPDGTRETLSNAGGRSVFDGSRIVVYRSIDTGKLWCRFTDEFRDGWFETIAAAPPAPQPSAGGEDDDIDRCLACHVSGGPNGEGVPNGAPPMTTSTTPIPPDEAGLQDEVERLRRLVFVPGMLKCAKCGFVLISAWLNANNGTVSAKDTTEHCPNDGSPMWRVSERDAGNEMVARCEQLAADIELLRPPGPVFLAVPREPTSVMLDAAYRKMRMDPSCAPFSKRILLKGWDAMLEAAPVLSSEGGSDAERG